MALASESDYEDALRKELLRDQEADTNDQHFEVASGQAPEKKVEDGKLAAEAAAGTADSREELQPA